MSYRNGSRHNPGFVQAESPMLSGPLPQQQSAPEKPTLTSPPQPFYYHHHRGHKRGHSYGGPVSPTTSAYHHARLEPRPSHPNTNHGTLPPSSQPTNSALLKGHRRALSGCMPMMGGIGVVAWSSLRELQSPTGLHAAVQGLRSRSPIEIPGEFQPGSPDGKKSFIRPMSPAETPKQSKGSMGDMECGFGPCTLPQYFNTFANIRVFVAILAVLVTLQQAVASGYVNSVITTIELRFEIPSKYTGLVASAYEMGNVVTVLFVSYLGAKRHIPRWIAVGVLVMVLGCIIFTLPHFLSPNPVGVTSMTSGGLIDFKSSNSYSTERLTRDKEIYNSQSTSNNSKFPPQLSLPSWNISGINSMDAGAGDGSVTHWGKNGVCHSQNPAPPSKFISAAAVSRTISGSVGGDEAELSSNTVSDSTGVDRKKLNPTPAGCEVEMTEDGTVKNLEPESYAHPLILFMLAQILLGVGGSPLFTLGITYVDDHVPKDSSSIFIGIIYAMGAFGPVLGFLLGAWLLTIPASWVSSNVPDSEFIGMWWGGFLIVGFLLFLACLPFFTFPRLLQKSSSKEIEFNIQESREEEGSSDDTIDPSYGQSIRDIPRSMFRLLKNPAYVITCLAGCMEMNIISGFVVFLPKYLETQFGLGKSEASVFTGGIAIPGAFFGILAGGYIMKRLQLSPSGAAKLVVITNCICLLGHACFFFLGCTNPKLAGATIPYPDSLNPLEYTPYNVNLTSFCNLDCNCDSAIDAQYVCAGGITYFSPCHAGCLSNLTQCTCAGGGDVTPGVCPDSPCTTLLPFMVILFFMTATVAMMQMPLLMIVLRSVSEEERSFALGMQFVLFRLLGYIPSPIIFGNVIDSACLLWSVRRCSTLLPAVSGRCLRYDILDFRYKYVGMLTGFKLVAISLFIYNFFQLRRMEKEEEKAELHEQLAAETEALKVTANSIDTLDRLFDDGAGGDGDLLAIGFEEDEDERPVPHSISMTTKESHLKT